ncbi:MAG: DUF2237 family protein, partial [Myxococcota bacterium]|nr:DUF2237 family protein [Myxococcota bacterium]
MTWSFSRYHRVPYSIVAGALFLIISGHNPEAKAAPKAASACDPRGYAEGAPESTELCEDQGSATEVSARGTKNVLGSPLTLCGRSPLTGYERDGFCHSGTHDRGVHVVCAVMNERFL